MGKIVKIVATIAIAVAIAVAAVPTGGLSLAVAGALGVSAAVASALIATTLSLASGLVMQALSPKPSTQMQPLNFKQSINDSQIIIGKCRVPVKLAFFHPVGKKLRYFVWVAAGHRVKGVTAWYLNNQVVNVDGSGQVTTGPYKGNAWLWFDRGEYDAVAFQPFVNECEGKWTSAHRGQGVAKIFAKFNLTNDVVEAGMPTVTAEIEGSDEILDPRTGQVGYTNNAQLCYAWWMKLPREEGGFGAYPEEMDDDFDASQASVCDEDIPISHVAAPITGDVSSGDHTINLQTVAGLAPGVLLTIGTEDETATVQSVNGLSVRLQSGLDNDYGAGTPVYWVAAAGVPATEKRYALDGYITAGADPSSVRDTLVTNMAGRFTYSGGKMLSRPGYWVPVSNSLEEDDLVSGIQIDLLTAADSRVTEVTASFNDPANLYQPQDLTARSTGDADVAQASLDLPFVKSGTRAQRLQKIALLRGSIDRTVTWPMNIMGMAVAPMDTVQLATDRYSLSNYAWTVRKWTIGQDFSIVLDLAEEFPEMYDWSVSDEVAISGTPGIDAVDPTLAPDQPLAASWQATGTTVTANGVSQPAISVGMVAADPETAFIDDVLIEYRVSGVYLATQSGDAILTETGDEIYTQDGAPGDWMQAGTFVPPATGMQITGVGSGGEYDVAISYRSDGYVSPRLVISGITAGRLSTSSAAHDLTTQSVAYPISSDDDSIIIAAFTGVVDDGRSISFPAGEIDGLASGTNFYVFWSPATSTYSAIASPALIQMADNTLIYLATYATSTAGVYPSQPTVPPGYVGGGTGCPVPSALVLLANEHRDGPGAKIAAGEIKAGRDWVWSPHERTGAWGAWPVTAHRMFASEIWEAERRPDTSPSHLWRARGGWTRMDRIGAPTGRHGDVVAKTIGEAHTYVLIGDKGEWFVSHNKGREAED